MNLDLIADRAKALNRCRRTESMFHKKTEQREKIIMPTYEYKCADFLAGDALTARSVIGKVKVRIFGNMAFPFCSC